MGGGKLEYATVSTGKKRCPGGTARSAEEVGRVTRGRTTSQKKEGETARGLILKEGEIAWPNDGE